MELLRYHVAYQLKRATHALTMALEKSVRPLGLTLSQANVLLFIDRFPFTTGPKLAELAAVTPQAMHRTVRVLERRSLVQRALRAGDQKSFYLSLTPKGSYLLQQVELRVKAIQDVVKDRLSPKEIKILQNLLEKYESAFSSSVGEMR